MFDGVIDDLTRASAEILSRSLAPAQTLKEFIAAHVRITLEDRMLMRVYHNEIANLPADDNRRLRRKQRIYIDSRLAGSAAAAGRVGRPGGREKTTCPMFDKPRER